MRKTYLDAAALSMTFDGSGPHAGLIVTKVPALLPAAECFICLRRSAVLIKPALANAQRPTAPQLLRDQIRKLLRKEQLCAGHPTHAARVGKDSVQVVGTGLRKDIVAG